MTIKDACDAFLDDEARFRNLARGTVQGYRSVLGLLTRWAERNGLSQLEDLEEDAIRA